jgi:DNA-directed RNA polymerase specialized sigma24 family protein
MQRMVTGSTGAVGGKRLDQLRAAAELGEFHRKLFLPLVRRAAWRHGLTKEDACDVVQEAFLLAVVKLKSPGNAAAWLVRSVDNLCVNLRRKGARRARLEAMWMHPGAYTFGEPSDS